MSTPAPIFPASAEFAEPFWPGVWATAGATLDWLWVNPLYLLLFLGIIVASAYLQLRPRRRRPDRRR